MSAVDLHLHSTASDGTASPEDVVAYARAAGVRAIALTDHDTLAGLPAARQSAGGDVRVVAGCEFSVSAWWGELHLLGYFLPNDDPSLRDFLLEQTHRREARGRAIVDRLGRLGYPLPFAAVEREANGAAIGRPHVARALVTEGQVDSVGEAFDRLLSDRGPAYVPKELPELRTVTELVRSVGGVTSAAHLKDRAGKRTLTRLAAAGVDAIEAVHPSHDPTIVHSIRTHAPRLGLLMTGGSDWHGPQDSRRAAIGSMDVPREWLEAVEALHRSRQ